jgi:hypothetical protein
MVDLAEIESFAYLYLEKHEIALITGCDIESLNNEYSAECKAFITGRLKRKAEFNRSLIRLTDQLSSPAMAIEHKLATTVQVNDKKR